MLKESGMKHLQPWGEVHSSGLQIAVELLRSSVMASALGRAGCRPRLQISTGQAWRASSKHRLVALSFVVFQCQGAEGAWRYK